MNSKDEDLSVSIGEKQAEDFVRKLFEIYFVEHDLELLKTMLHKDAVLLGMCIEDTNLKAADVLLKLDRDHRSGDGKFRIKNQTYDVQRQDNNNSVIVYGSLCVEGINAHAVPFEAFTRFSLICLYEENQFRLLHAHFSVPQENDEQIMGTADSHLEKMLEERTRLLQEREAALRLSEKRYEIALSISELTMFEYDIITKDLIFYNGIGEMYMLPSIVPDGPETLVRRGTIEPASVQGYREMYRKIHAGEPTASCFITTKDMDEVMHNYELTLTTIFDHAGKPVRAIGVRKNVSRMLFLQKEQEFAKTLVAGRVFVCEADITNNMITDINPEWADKYKLKNIISISDLTKKICGFLIVQEHQEMMREMLNRDYLLHKFEKGETLILFQFKSKSRKDGFVWQEAMINMICDERTGSIHARFYQTDIHERKVKEERAAEEQRMYESMIDKVILACEVNITRNYAAYGHGKKIKPYHADQNNDYSRIVKGFARKYVYPEDEADFEDLFGRSAVLRQFYEGKHQMKVQGRIQTQTRKNELKWICCTLNLYEDPDSGDVKGFLYVEDIDEKKRLELTLIYKAEHDMMTSLYNKTSTETKITEFLHKSEYKKNMHALLMIDIDYFKNINDHYGHAFGDKVLCELSSRIKNLFREEDIAGRIGGDEFCVLMKHIPSADMVRTKAEELCKALNQSYEFEDKSCTLSASVGVAVYPKNGRSYDELFRKADEMLYRAKKKGRNCYCIEH